MLTNENKTTQEVQKQTRVISLKNIEDQLGKKIDSDSKFTKFEVRKYSEPALI